MSLTKEELAERLKSRLEDLDSFRGYAGDEAKVRCPSCGDSENEQSAHLYIKVVPEELVYFCFRCRYSGRVDADLLVQLGIADHDLGRELKSSGNSSYSGKRKGKTLSLLTKPVRIELPKVNRSSDKVAYLEERLDCTFSDKRLKRYKVVVDLADLLDKNDIDTITVSSKIFKVLTKHYVGFLLTGKAYVMLRKVSGSDNNPKHFMYRVNNAKDSDKLFYVPQQELNLLAPKQQFAICEGIIDAIGLDLYFRNIRGENTVVMASLGKNHTALLQQVLQLGFLDARVGIYLDKDDINGSRGGFKKLPLEHLSATIKYYYNLNNADYGVPKHQIKLKEL